jgi:hypothetical protein
MGQCGGQVGDAYDFKAVNAYIKENGYEGELGLIKWDQDNVLRAQEGAPVVHYQVQGGELKPIFTDPPTDALPGQPVHRSALDQVAIGAKRGLKCGNPAPRIYSDHERRRDSVCVPSGIAGI